MNVIIALCGAFLFLLLIAGCVLKIGRDSLCSSVTSTVPNVTKCNNTQKRHCQNELLKMSDLMLVAFFCKSCEDAQNKSWTSPFKGESFYKSLFKAEVNRLL